MIDTEIVYEDAGIMIERLCSHVYLVRGYADDTKYPGVYESVVTIRVYDSLAVLKGMVHEDGGKRFTIKQVRDIYNFLRSLRCVELHYERSKNGKMISVTRKL